MLKKKNKAYEMAKIISNTGGYDWFFYSRCNDIMINGYFDECCKLIKALEIRFNDMLGILPDLRLHDLSIVKIETEKKKFILHNLRLTHIRTRYEPFYIMVVDGETEVLVWEEN